MRRLMQLLSILMLPQFVVAQQYKTRTISQFKWDDSNDVKIVCKEHYNDKGRLMWKGYTESQSVIDAEEDGDDKGTKVFYTYKDSLLTSEHRYRSKEYEDTAITEHSYNDKGLRVQTTIRRHDLFAAEPTKGQINKVAPEKLDTTYAENPQTGEMWQIIQKKDEWRWLNDTIRYQYNAAGKLAGQSGGEKWHKISYNDAQRTSQDMAYSSPAELKAKSYSITTSHYSAEKKLLKKVKDHYALGKKDFDHTVEYTYANGKLIKAHSTATSFSKSKAADAKFDNLRFDKKYYYNANGTINREETLDPDGSKLLTTLYHYE